jgi:hypothetical protein
LGGAVYTPELERDETISKRDMGSGMKIVLPWPDSVLFPNSAMREGAMYQRRSAAREYSQTAYLETHNTIVKAGCAAPRVRALTMDFYPPNNRRDLLNMPAAMKSAIDGIFDYIGQNDKQVVEELSRVHPADKQNPRVVICLIGENENE